MVYILLVVLKFGSAGIEFSTLADCQSAKERLTEGKAVCIEVKK